MPVALQVKACLQAAAEGKEFKAAEALKASPSDDMNAKLELAHGADDEREDAERDSIARKLSQKEVCALCRNVAVPSASALQQGPRAVLTGRHGL